MNTDLVNAEKEKYERDGYVIFPDVLDPDTIEEAREHIDWLVKKYPDVRPENLHSNFMPNDPFWVRLVSDDKLLDVAEKFIGPNIAVFRSQYLSKPPYIGREVLWHQDGSYWDNNLDSMDAVTLWLAVDDSTPENGCMRVIPGTHKVQLQKMRARKDVENVLGSEIDPSFVDESKAVDVILKKGSVSIHHPNIIHGSNANKSPYRRCGLTIRYIPTSTKILSEKPWPYAFLLRGEAVPGLNTYQTKPKYVEGEHMKFRGCENWK